MVQYRLRYLASRRSPTQYRTFSGRYWSRGWIDLEAKTFVGKPVDDILYLLPEVMEVTAQVVPPDDLVLELTFYEGSGNIAHDSSKYDNHGTVYGATWTQESGVYALYFDGVDDYVEVPDNSVLNPETFSVEVVFRPVLPHGGPYTNAVINKAYYAEPPDGKGWYLRFFGATSLKLQFGVYFDDAEVTVYKEVTEDWHHAVGVYDGSYVRLYVDGELAAEKAGGTTYQVPSGYPLRLGSWGAYHGYIALARYYSKPLTDAEVKKLFEAVASVLPLG
ncbi:MAG: LamG domain-containing protein [Deltaproteobacteria bacterium]|nr:LamG domain-containing protein [Deltaproteobacteria bacterium]